LGKLKKAEQAKIMERTLSDNHTAAELKEACRFQAKGRWHKAQKRQIGQPCPL
jgi:hypothetical protein